MDDADLVNQVLQGNMGAYAELVRRYTAQIAALCRAHIDRAVVVEDLVQETFGVGLGRLVTLKKPGSFGSWLYAIARNLCRDWLNDPNNRHLSLDLTASERASSKDNGADDRNDRIAALKECIRHLPVREREVIEIYYGGGRITYQQLADRQELSSSLVNKLLTNARKMLCACLERGSGTTTHSP